MAGKAAIIKQQLGHGAVICSACHPEQTIGLEDFTFDLITYV